MRILEGGPDVSVSCQFLHCMKVYACRYEVADKAVPHYSVFASVAHLARRISRAGFSQGRFAFGQVATIIPVVLVARPSDVDRDALGVLRGNYRLGGPWGSFRPLVACILL